MKNIDLNPGGLIGAIGGASLAALIVYLAYRDAGPPTAAPSVRSFFLGLLIGGAFAGNFLWDRIVKKEK